MSRWAKTTCTCCGREGVADYIPGTTDKGGQPAWMARCGECRRSCVQRNGVDTCRVKLS